MTDIGGGLDAEQQDKVHSTEKINYRNIEYTPTMTRDEKQEIMDYIFNIFNVSYVY